MLSDWNHLTDDLQLVVSQEAMYRAALTIAERAELLAAEIEAGRLSDRGGPEALRLLAAIIRLTGEDPFAPAGHA
jgi:hypothetical protein